MLSVDLFFKTLKQIGYPDADSLDDYDFNLLLSEETLKPFFEVFCTLNENNVLTTEEIEEYSALSPSELAEIEALKKSHQFEQNDIDLVIERRKEGCFLQQQLIQIENHNKILEKQIDLIKKQEEYLFQEKDIQQKYFFKAKERFKMYEISRIPAIEDEFVSILKSALLEAQAIESLIMQLDCNENKLPMSNFFKDLIQEYLEVENKILHSINAYMETNLQLLEDGTLEFIRREKTLNEELEKEALILKKKLKNSLFHNAMSEIKISKIENMITYFKDFPIADMNCPASLLRHKLDDALKLNENLKKKEEEYKEYLSDAISKQVDAFVAEVALCIVNETNKNLQIFNQKISIPKKFLVQQRLRVEMLISLLKEYKDKLHNLKELILKFLKLMGEELSSVQERRILIEKELCRTAEKKVDEFPETLVFSSLYKILANFEESKAHDLPKISLTDVEQKASKILEIEDNVKRKHEENIKILENIENHAHSLELLLCAGKQYSGWNDLEQSLNANLNSLTIKLAVLEENVSECSKDLDQKQKLLEKRRNLQLTRKLYVYALTNREIFTKSIEDIKVAIKNSADF